jgi:tetratricopeptide (TPR) repeat protein
MSIGRAWWWMLGLLLLAGRARADDRAWAQGVSAERQAHALQLFQEGNARFAESRHDEALAKYRDALSFWDHPGIHYNLAVALIHLDQPLAAHEQLEQALRYGKAPFDGDTFEQARTYQKLLLGRIAHLEVGCGDADAEVALDGEKLFSGPGKSARFLMPGTHQLVATKPGYFTASRPLLLLTGTPAVVVLQLEPVKPQYRRRWSEWKPWLIAATGVAFALTVGVPLELQAKSDAQQYDAVLHDKCANGCLPQSLPQSARDLQSRPESESAVAITAFTVGGVLAAAGVVMLVLNRPRLLERARVTPQLSWNGAGLAGRF